MAGKKENKGIKVTLVKSGIGYNVKQKQTLLGLGLKKMNRPQVLNDTPAIRGMIARVSHLVVVEEV